MTDEIEAAPLRDATPEPGVPSVIAQLGVEARAEYVRARQRLGLGDEPTDALGAMGRYRLEAELGRGGMGIVFRARDPDLDRPVAIKLVQAVPFARYDKLRTRLLREAKVLARLTHPNVVRIYDCGQHEGEVYLAMELVEGATLRDWQQRQSPRAILGAYQQAAKGLAAAHDLGITHRDFKPDNVLVARDGRVLVGDFGLAGAPAGDELRAELTTRDASSEDPVPPTRTGALLGTPTYMAPEQLRGDPATPRSDQFAFCVSLWEALTGQRPFAGQTREELLEQIEERRVRGAERLPRRLRTRLTRGLAVEPEDRFDHLRDLTDALVPRWGRVAIATAVAVSMTVGVGVGWGLAAAPIVHPPCQVLASAQAVVAMPDWSRVQAQPLLAPMYEDLEALGQGMLEEATALCKSPDDTRRAWLERRIEGLATVVGIAPTADPVRLLEAIEALRDERWTGPPPSAVSTQVAEHIQRSRASQLVNDFEGALAEAKQALAEAGDDALGQALAHQQRGRVLALLGRHEEAMHDYSTATSHAEIALYDNARLETELLAAKTAAMRLGDLERAQDSLDRAYGLLIRFDEPWLSSRWADYHEVLAAVLKRDGEVGEALEHQWAALFIRGLWGNVIGIGMGYTNLGTMYEMRGARGTDDERKRLSYELARLSYERAIETLEPVSPCPEWFEARFNLAHWLVSAGGPDDWKHAKTLLEEVRAESNDASLSALTDLLLLSIRKEDAKAARAFAKELEAALLDTSPSKPSLSQERRLDAWQNVTSGYALAEEPNAFDDARAAFGCVVQETVAHGSPAQVDAVLRQTADLDLTTAFALSEVAPERARALATSALRYYLSLPQEKQDEEIASRIGYANDLLGALAPPTPPSRDSQ